MLSAKKTLRELNVYKRKLKYNFKFSKLLSDPTNHFFKYAEQFQFSGILNESREKYIERKKYEFDQRGEIFDPSMVLMKPGKPILDLNVDTKKKRLFKRREVADYLRKYDYRKLAYEQKNAGKK